MRSASTNPSASLAASTCSRCGGCRSRRNRVPPNLVLARQTGNRREMHMPELDPLRWKALAVVCAAFFMTVLDVSIVNVALPSIGRDLHFSAENLQWVITAYAITFGGFLLLGGRAADLLGRRRVF